MLVKCFSSAFAHKIIVVEDVTAHVTQARSDTKDTQKTNFNILSRVVV